MTPPQDASGNGHTSWTPPIDVSLYDRAVTLQDAERTTLEAIVVQQHRVTGGRRVVLERLVRPLSDVFAALASPPYTQRTVVRAMAADMHARAVSYWGWTPQEWVETIGQTAEYFSKRQGCASPRSVRQTLAIVAYLLGGFTDFSAFNTGRGFTRVLLARRIFGTETIEHAATTVFDIARGWGYGQDCRLGIQLALAAAFLDNRSPRLADLSRERLAVLHAHAYHRSLAEAFVLVSRVLAAQGVLQAPLLDGRRRVPFWDQVDTTGMAPAWSEWCRRWHAHDVRLSPSIRDAYARLLLRAGRWLAQAHPTITSPEQWTYEVAAEWSAEIGRMTVGAFCAARDVRLYAGRYGEPLSPRSKVSFYAAMQTFFLTLLEEPFGIRRRFDAMRAFRVPTAVRQAINPDPRTIDIRWWSMIVHAAVHLTEDDLPHSPMGPRYPLLLMRAMAIVWCYAALRTDEIRRLAVGCIRWQREDVTSAESGATLAKEAVCFLTVPVNKTNTSFCKAVNPLVGQAIEAWEKDRPVDQPRQPDRKTGQFVDYLFAYKGRTPGRAFINTVLIPLLCGKAGLPTEDERGNITGHRARSTIATALYNAPEGMTIWELMQWLGHKNPSSTQQYARVNPTTVAVAYEKAERNSCLVEALVDHTADPHGDVKVYYVLGDHGLCSNAEWYTCIYRMACIKCPFFIPQDQASVIRSRNTVETFLKRVQLTPEEIAAVEDDRDKLIETHERTRGLPVPRMIRQCGRGVTTPGIPVQVLQDQSG
jgi:integrase